jgi:hypothetical protein
MLIRAYVRSRMILPLSSATSFQFHSHYLPSMGDQTATAMESALG